MEWWGLHVVSCKSQGDGDGEGELFNLNCGYEDQILIHLPSELLTRLKDAIFSDNWEIQVFQVFGWSNQDENANFTFQLWTVPEQGRFSYNLVVFAKGGIIYRFPIYICDLLDTHFWMT